MSEQECKVFWDYRKGLVPIVGAAREPGTSMVIEDVACPVKHLGEMSLDLIEMFQKYGYKEASLMGHALEGNLHTVFSQVRNASQFVFNSVLIVHAGIRS
jgi:D-lactate dehydrogenase